VPAGNGRELGVIQGFAVPKGAVRSLISSAPSSQGLLDTIS